ncbi:ABC transporter ATP-binding protein [Yeosuana aromativorans]|uniref:ABC transporter ATP-binding protein n=1 Tax=Yeosuana aromativorans TaxID=288019 RepID=A0A8J3FE86_9FLAO|nr:ABC transporter ATP-binding protein [Yeosuana aromativorans]GGK14634.1 ABC transporter ATP-binding protein [Yeosuana aromativorans]
MLQVKNMTFGYQDKPIIENISFKADRGEHLSIIGESGSGKSTLLKLVYGTYDLDEGQIFWGEHKILGPKYNLIIDPEYMKYVAQEFDLMPFTSVAENIGEFLSNFYPEEKQQRIAELLKVVELEAFAKTKVKLLSGGQKQRVALARALAKQPEIILLDEPFSHIDNFKKQSLRRSLFKYLKDKQITCIVATHDQEDVISFSDNMMVLHNARILAYGSPKDLYNNPKDKLVASFFGEFNLMKNLGIVYANQLKVVPKSTIEATVKKSYFKGHYYLIEATVNEDTVFFEHDTALQKGLNVFLKVIK